MSVVIHGLHLPKMLGGEEAHIDIRIFSGGDVIMATSKPPYYKKFKADQFQDGQEIPAPPQKDPLCDTCKHAIDGVVDDFAAVFCAARCGYFGQVTECGDYERKKTK